MVLRTESQAEALDIFGKETNENYSDTFIRS